jgi:adenylate cyclase
LSTVAERVTKGAPHGSGRAPSFWTKVATISALVAVIPLVVVGLLVDNLNHRALGEVNRSLLALTLENVAGTARTLTDSTDVALEAIGASLLGDRNPDEKIALAQAVASVRGITAVGVYDEKGQRIDTLLTDTGATGPPLPEQIEPVTRAEFGAVTILRGHAFALRRVPLRGKERAWTLATIVSLSAIEDRVTALVLHSLPPGSSVLVVTTDLLAVADSAGERVGKLVDATDAGVLDGITPQVLAKGFLLDGEFDRAGTPVIGAIRTIEQSPFAVVAEIPRKVAFSSITRVRRAILIAVGLAIMGALVAGVLLARRLVRPIKALVDFADDLAHRRFTTRLAIRPRDELGVLGDALETAASELAASDEKLQREAAIRTDLGRYLPTQLVDQIVARERVMTLGGERREVTVLFADVVGFTPLAERESAETVVTLLNELFTILTELVFRHGGTVDKFIGDCVMAVWGAPEPRDDHAHRALLAATEMQRWLETSNESWMERFGVRIELAIGVNSGEAVVGNFGSETRMEYTAIGDVVNVAARLESIARPGQILTTRATRDRASAFTFAEIGSRSLAGKSEPVELFEVRR